MKSATAENIRKIIQSKGLKQIAVAERAGYSKQQFNAMLRERKVIKDTDIMRIATALEVDANTLFMARKGSG